MDLQVLDQPGNVHDGGARFPVCLSSPMRWLHTPGRGRPIPLDRSLAGPFLHLRCFPLAGLAGLEADEEMAPATDILMQAELWQRRPSGGC